MLEFAPKFEQTFQPCSLHGAKLSHQSVQQVQEQFERHIYIDSTKLNEHPLQNPILLRKMEWEDLRRSGVRHVVAESLSRTELVYLSIRSPRGDEVDDVDVDTFQVLYGGSGMRLQAGYDSVNSLS